MRRPAAALAFLALSGAGGAGLGSTLRWYWDLRVRTAPLRGSAQALLVTFDDWGDVLVPTLGILVVATLFRRLVSSRSDSRPAHRHVLVEAAIWLALAAGSLIWSHSHARGVAFWGGAAIHTGLARLSLLALEMSFRVVRDLARSARLAPAAAGLSLYLAGRWSFVTAFMVALRLRGEDAMYLVLPLAATTLECLVFVVATGLGLLVAQRVGRSVPAPTPAPPSPAPASGKSP